MEETVLIYSMALLITIAAACSIILSRVHMPALIGFLITGIVFANYFELSVEFEEVIEVFSNLGLIMLMFAIGMEIDVRKIKEKGLFAMIVACVQLPLMLFGGMLGGMLMGFNLVQCIALGALISGSSTAVVTAVLKAQGTLDREHIEMLVLITIMEDIGQVVILSIITPVLQGGQMNGQDLMMLILNIAFFMSMCFVVGLRVVPRIIDWLSDRISDELTAILCVGLAFGLAYTANKLGLSVAIGAFLMGVMIASTVKREMIERFVDPLKSLFMAMFFISVGMEVTISGITDNLVQIFLIFLLFVILKSSTVFLGYWIGNEAPRNGFVSGVALCAMGEFAFIIAKAAFDADVFSADFYSSVIGAALLSMIFLPVVTRYTGRFWDFMERKSPMGLRNRCASINKKRSDIYASLNSLPSKGRAMFRTGIGYAYLSVVVIIIVEIVFYYAYEPASWWLEVHYGFYDRAWFLLLMSLNFWLLFMPCRTLVNQLRLVAYTYTVGKESSKPPRDRETSEHIRFYEAMNPLLVALGLDILVIIVSPVHSDSLFTVINFVVAVVIVTAVRYYRLRKGKSKFVPLPDINEDSASKTE